MKFFALSNSRKFAYKLVENNNLKLGDMETVQFSDNEFKVKFNESVRGKRIVIIGSMRSSDDIMEFMMACDAAKRASAKEIIALIPYMGYMRQDKKDTPRTSIGSKVITNMIEMAGVDQLISLDFHVDQIEGFFDIAVTHLNGYNIFPRYLRNNVNLDNTIIVSPDFGASKRSKKFASKLELPIAIIDKERIEDNKVSKMELIGDVKGKEVIIVDDIIDTSGSIVKAVDLLFENGAVNVSACITHGVLSGDAINRINNSRLSKLYVTDSIDISHITDEKFLSKLKIITSTFLFSKVFEHIQDKKSVHNLVESL